MRPNRLEHLLVFVQLVHHLKQSTLVRAFVERQELDNTGDVLIHQPRLVGAPFVWDEDPRHCSWNPVVERNRSGLAIERGLSGSEPR
jgi:hypothetical protein